MSEPVSLEEVLELVKQLPPRDKVRLIAWVAPQIEDALAAIQPKQRKSLWGLCRDLGPAPSALEIDIARNEMWSDFPRQDI
jgi:hypothetical protein